MGKKKKLLFNTLINRKHRTYMHNIMYAYQVTSAVHIAQEVGIYRWKVQGSNHFTILFCTLQYRRFRAYMHQLCLFANLPDH